MASTNNPPGFEEICRNAYQLIADALKLLQSDWPPGTGPTPVQAELLHEARAGLLRAKRALDEAGRKQP